MDPGRLHRPFLQARSIVTLCLSVLAVFPVAGCRESNRGFFCDSSHWHAGNVRTDVPVRHDFRISNSTRKTVRIRGARGTCQCTSIAVYNSLVPAGGEALVSVTLKPAHRGPIMGIVYVSTDSPDYPTVRLAVTAYAVQPFLCTESAYFGTLTKDRVAVKPLVARFAKGWGFHPPAALKVEVSDPRISCGFGAPVETDSYRIFQGSVGVSGREWDSVVSGSILVKSMSESGQVLASIRVPVSGFVAQGCRVDPRALFLPHARVGEPSTVDVKVTAPLGGFSAVPTLSASGPCTTSWKGRGDDSLFIEITVTPEGKGYFYCEVSFVESPAAEPLRVLVGGVAD